MGRYRLALALVGTLAATCQGAVRWYTNDYEGGLEVARKSGRPMVIIFHTADDKLRTAKKLFESEMLAPYHRQFVFSYNEVEVKNGTMSHGLFHKYNPGDGAHSLPIIFFADTDEKVLGKMENPSRVGEIAAEMAAVLKKLGGPGSAKKTREAQEALDRGNALLAKKQFGPAAKCFKEVVDLNLKLPATETAKKELAKLEEMAAKQLEAARADVKDKAYPEAARKLAELDEAFSPMPAAREAREELAKLHALPEAKEALAKAVKKEATAQAPPRHTDDPNDIAGDFFTEEELDALDKMAGGDEAKAEEKGADATAECRRLLSFARGWIANKQNAKAREALEKVIAKYPDTLYADQAKALLENLK
ncbi:MAG: hypothetical protein FJ290_10645 [Planctomycetes bacterium]|nr:hypothetical protein [Planctomycetota bacterium]